MPRLRGLHIRCTCMISMWYARLLFMTLRSGMRWCAAVHNTPGAYIEIAVGLDGDRQPAMPPVGQRAAHRRRRAVSDAAAAGVAQPLIGLVEIPEPPRPAATIAVVARHERPVLVLDLRPQLGGQASGAHRARVPGVRWPRAARVRARRGWPRPASRRALRRRADGRACRAA